MATVTKVVSGPPKSFTKLSVAQFGPSAAGLNTYRTNMKKAGYAGQTAGKTSPTEAMRTSMRTGALFGALGSSGNTMWDMPNEPLAATPPSAPQKTSRLANVVARVLTGSRAVKRGGNIRHGKTGAGRHHGMNAAHLRAATGAK